MITMDTTTALDASRDRIVSAARHLYDAECALHVAHQTRVDAWVKAASDRLHDAVVSYLTAVAEQQPGSQP
jgi:hypothetical protein